MKKLLILLWVLALSIPSAYAQSGLDAPHNETNTIACLDCHGTTPPTDDTVCLQCHVNASGGGYSKNSAPKVATHSSATTSTKYGTWAVACRDCHRAHTQKQRAMYGSATYLGTGTITSVAYDDLAKTTTFGYSGFTTSPNRTAWADFTKWGAKTSKERGLIIYPTIANFAVNFEIISATANTITTRGPLSVYAPSTVPVGSTFALTYGEDVRATLQYPTTLNPSITEPSVNVKFFDHTGPNSFAFDESGTHTDPTPDGVCQVCHDKTSHWRRDGTLAAVGIHSTLNGANCTGCHLHTDGFKPSCNSCHGYPPVNTTLGGPSGLVNNPAVTGSTTAGAHVKHATSGAGNYDFDCEKCHTGGMPASAIPDMKIEIGFNMGASYQSGTYNGRTLPLPNGYSYLPGNAGTTITNTGAMSCTNIYCHSNAKIGTTVQAYATPVWTGAPLICSSCHGNPPSYANGGAGAPTANSHVVHVTNNNFGCQLCHNKTTTNGTTITDTTFHVNTTVDVFFDSSNPSGTYTPATKTCSTTVCHGAGTPQWGGSVKCQDCHLGAADLDNFTGTFWNNGIRGTISSSEWGSTGHGKASGVYTSGNPAAAFTSANACTYCHDSTIAHKDGTNPFRLRNITDATWGKNGACQLCHATGSAGVMVDGVLKNGTKKIGSTHYGSKHTTTLNGGQFCWDCHDPHGDTNIFMVHKSVAKTSNASTGAPLTTADPIFTAFATGTDYAKSTAPFNGICNVCHTTTSHYTATSGDGHNAGTRCTTCHLHTGNTTTNAFRPSCDTCHGSPPVSAALGGPNGLVNNPAPTGSTTAGAHVKHATGGTGNYGFVCEKCHTGGMPASAIPDMKIEIGFNMGASYQSGTYNGRTLPLPNGYSYLPGNAGTTITNTGAMSCTNIYCHSNAKIGTTVQAYATPVWTGAPLICSSCHGNPPSYANGGAGAPTANSHVVHVTNNNFGCQLCHNKTTTNGTTITDTTFHVNTTVDVFFDSSNPSGTYTPATKTCSTTVCHGAGTPQWGGSVKCQDCHLGAADLDNFTGTFWNNGTRGTISSSEWGSTGHGLASGVYTSGNSAAAFTSANACTYCHDSTIAHKDGTNPFRLRNITDATWGKNGACQLCHATGSAGVMVDGVLKNGTKKIGSTHYGAKHTAALNGGQFCWDCHDPHGDTNIFMIHKSVAMTSDASTAAPLTTADPSFTAFATGTDYAKSSSPFNGVCNVCHTTTIHYTSTSGDGHNAGTRCTQCHNHTGKTTTDAFGVDCLSCHSTSQGNRVAVVNQLTSGNSHHIQGVTLTNQMCYQCHWEANSDGSVNATYHGGSDHPGAPVQLVIYGAGARPATYTLGTTAVAYTAGGSSVPPPPPPAPFVKVVDTWRQLTTSGTGSSRTASFTAGAGTIGNRMVIIGLGWEHSTTSGCNPSAITGNYGGQTITTINKVSSSNNREGQWMGYVREAGIAAKSNNTITLTFNGCTPNLTPTMSVATYEGVDQATAPASAVASGTTGSAFTWTGLPVVSGGYAMYNLNADGISSFTPPAMYIERYDVATTNFRMTGGDKTITAAGTESQTVTGNASASRWALVAVAVKPTAAAPAGDPGRAELAKINQHCLGCHSAQNNTTQPFGDSKTPKQYAWDGLSIAERYSQTGATPWGKYSGANVTPKNTQTKAFSSHGNAAANQRGWDLNETWPNMSGGVNVLCFDCHNSHGSTVSGTTTSYTSATVNGAMLKDTTAGKGGYKMTYRPQVEGSVAGHNVSNPGASLCIDCHMTQKSGTTPWGYLDTFNSSQPIMGYWEKPYWTGAAGVNPSGAQQRYPYKNLIGSQGGHFGASSSLTTQVMGTIGGLCTPCHDPHGVSPSLGVNQAYGVPLLKGTWMTSPYKEDAAPQSANQTVSVRGEEGRGGTTAASIPGYHIDQNTFAAGWNFSSTAKVTQTTDQFAGLCLKCHPKSSLAPNVTTAWKSVDRIHNSVKGWGTVGANNGNAIHAYTCSKCHTPHNSCLPRLVISDCLDVSHRGQVGTGGAANHASGRGEEGRGSGSYPAGGGGSGSGVSSGSNQAMGFGARSCHDSTNSSGWPANQFWNTKTPWGTPGTPTNIGGGGGGG